MSGHSPMVSPARIRAIVERGDIISTRHDAEPRVGRYQGNGRFGCIYSHLGLHASPAEQAASEVHGQTQFMHLRHWGRFRFYSDYMQANTSADYVLPLARIFWASLPTDLTDYQQRQSFYDGTVATSFTCAGARRVEVTTWFDPVERDLAMVRVEVAGDVPALVVAPVTTFQPYPYGHKASAHQSFLATPQNGQWEIEVTCETCEPRTVSRLYLRTDATIEIFPDGLKLFLREGVNLIALSHGKPIDASQAADSLERTRRHWHATWQKTAWIDFPEEASQQMWVRSLAYILSSFNDDGFGFAPTNGLTGNVFPFNFAQDLFYVHPLLLATGHVAVAKTWIERFSRLIPAMQRYARRLWPSVRGIYPPWELPFGDIEGYHEPSVPIFYCYEPHNAAYLARMADETGERINDDAWTAEHVAPLIREIALFFRSFCAQGTDGLWHLTLTPAIGQDEAGGRNQSDYLCALYGAKFSFQKAIAHGFDRTGDYRKILEDGLAFPALLSEQGFYYASSGSGAQDFGRQKHPVQLNGLAYLPVERQPLPPERVAYALRYATTKLAQQPFFFGWTLGEFLLAGSHLQDADGWRKDWNQVLPSRYTDENRVQFYETSGSTRQSFYLTTHGLVAQSLCANLVSDYWGELVIGACPVYSRRVRFGNVVSRLGVTVSGEIGGDQARVVLVAWKECRFALNGQPVQLRSGEAKSFELILTPPVISRASHAQPTPSPVQFTIP